MEDGARMDVVVVDDSEGDSELVVRAFRRCSPGTRVRVARTAAEALGVLRSSPPGLVVLDVKLPGMSGLELLGTIKRDEALAQVPVVVVTDSCCPEDAERATELGASGFLQKPFDPTAWQELCDGLWSHASRS